MKSSEIINGIHTCMNLRQSESAEKAGKGNRIISTDEIVTLYHGSKSGIHGAIAPVSRERCDFGKGVYMGTERTQPLGRI